MTPRSAEIVTRKYWSSYVRFLAYLRKVAREQGISETALARAMVKHQPTTMKAYLSPPLTHGRLQLDSSDELKLRVWYLESLLDEENVLDNVVRKNLESGRSIGAAVNRARSLEAKQRWRQISVDLWQKKPFWGVEEHVRHILKNPAADKGNGESYSAWTIRDAIKGTKAEAKKKALG